MKKRFHSYSSVSAGVVLRINVNGTNTGSQFSQVASRGGNAATVTLAGALHVTAIPALPTDITFAIIDNDGTDAVSGTFSRLPNNATFLQSGYTCRISYTGGTGNDVMLTIVAASQPPIEAQWLPPSLVLSLPDWASDYSLRSTTNLALPSVWLPAMHIPLLRGGKWSLALPVSSAGNQFFRLMSLP